ncbi:uncharacterized protein Z520_03003 [Fonsecaea multimorphosa CBS 102226]|uniref:Uncharacterized protein n=1 Tax=Fonsecaea multimorphosa CBS 102226 TaxID=1442371 RepID=A0A0D2HHU4_9EURO|nr:uncharacterized protein Z520_03003 [Fonsecaea multimorphosa CBS 102226]KIY01451.1 hypothetical protein Z520_03003 [Fonsecaea multimorphosa CBS 102226]OAL28468.1 hypothetical protein AYO22_02922 [Fonsecaea multimorphosa]
MPSSIKSVLRRLEVKHDGEVYSDRPPTRWGNRDVFPVPLEQRRYTVISYVSYWSIASLSVTSWAYGGSVIALGLSAGEGIACSVIGSLFVGLFAFLCGHPGASMHVGFTALARVTFGLYGSYIPVLLLVFENVIFFGIHAYFGGLAVTIVLNALSSSFMHWKNTLPESAGGVTSQGLIGFVIYFVVFFLLLLIHPSKLRNLVWPAAITIAVVFLGLLGWAISANGGTVGNLLAGKIHLSSTNKSFAMLYAISSAAGSATAFSSRVSDWTRFAVTKHSATVPMLVFAPIFGCIGPIFGILATSAVYSRYQAVEWNPLGLLLYVQATQYTAGCRAATFFAGLGLFCASLMNNLMGKISCAGMDCAGLFPKYITTRRGSYILTVIGILIQPWRLVNGSSTFLTVLASFGVFVAPMTGILAADYWIVRRRKWVMHDIYRQDGIYWYTFGVNWRAYVAFIMSFVFDLPGFAASVNKTSIAPGWTRMYDMSYIVNLAIAVLIFCCLSFAFPPKGLGVAEGWDDGSVVGENKVTDPTVAVEQEKEERVYEVECLPPAPAN